MRKMMVLSAAVLAVAISAQGLSFAEEVQGKYGIVDVKKVVNSSKSVNELKKQRQEQKEKVLKFVKESNAKVSAEKDPAKQEELKKKLNNDLQYMTNTYDKNYKDGLLKINDEINADIAKIGKEKQYDLILTTDAVLYGGQNITNEIVKEVK